MVEEVSGSMMLGYACGEKLGPSSDLDKWRWILRKCSMDSYHVAFIHVRSSRRGIIGRWDRSWGNVGPERDAELLRFAFLSSPPAIRSRQRCYNKNYSKE